MTYIIRYDVSRNTISIDDVCPYKINHIFDFDLPLWNCFAYLEK